MQKLIFMLKLNINNKEMLLQLSLKIEIRNFIINCKKTIIVIVVKSVRSEIQYSYYWIIKNSWENRNSKACLCI